MDQDINRTVHISIEEDVSPTLMQLSRAWNEMQRQVADVTEQVAALSTEFDRRFRPMANGAFQDMDNGAKIATNRAREMAAQLSAAANEMQRLQEAQANVTSQVQRGISSGAASFDAREQERIRAQFASEISLRGRPSTNAEIAAQAEVNRLDQARMAQMRQDADVLDGVRNRATIANEKVITLESNVRDLIALLENPALAGMPGFQNRQFLMEQLNQQAAEAGRTTAPDIIPGYDEARERRAVFERQKLQDDVAKAAQQEADRAAAAAQRQADIQQKAAERIAAQEEARQRKAVFDQQRLHDDVARAAQQEADRAEALAQKQAATRARDVEQAEIQYARQATALEASQRKAEETAQRAAQRPGAGTQRAAAAAAAAEEAQLTRTVASAEAAAQKRAAAAISGERQAVEASEAATRRYLELQQQQVGAAQRAATQKAELSRQVAIADQQADEQAERRARRQSLGGQFGHAILNTALYSTAFTAIMALEQAATSMLEAMFQKPAEAETAIVVYTRYLGDATKAQERFNTVMKESTQIGLPAKDILELDTRLAQLGVTSETSTQRFGRSLEQVRKDLEDLSASPSLDPQQVIEFFTRAADGANRLLLSLKSAGVTTETELRELGVRMNRQGTQILSDNDTTTRALLSVIERHYSGLAEATGRTGEGMAQRWANTWDQIARTFGEKSGIFDEVKRRQQGMLEAISSEGAQSGMEKIAERMGDVVTLVLLGFDVMTRAALQFGEKVGGVLSNIPGVGGTVSQLDSYTSGVHERIEEYRKAVNDTTDDTANLGSVSQDSFSQTGKAIELAKISVLELNDALDEMKSRLQLSQRTERNIVGPIKEARDAMADMQDTIDKSYDKQLKSIDKALDGIRKSAKESQDKYEAQIDPLQIHLREIQRAAEDVRSSYEAQIKPLKEQETQLQRSYDLQQRMADLARLDTKIGRAQALAVDIYSSQGRAAAEQLPDLLNQRADLQGRMALDAEKQKLEDRIAHLEAERDQKLQGIENDQRRTQDQIALIQAREKADADSFARDEKRWQDKKSALEDERDRFHEISQAAIDAADKQIKAIQKQFDKQQQGIQAEIDKTNDQIALLDKVINGALGATQNYAEMVANTIKKVFDSLDDSITKARGDAADIPTGERDFTKPSYEDNPPPPTTMDRGPGHWYLYNGQWIWQSDGPTSQTPSAPMSSRSSANLGASTASVARGLAGANAPDNKLTILMQDNMGREQFREYVELDREHINKQVAVSMRENR